MRTMVGCLVWIVDHAAVLLFQHDRLMRLPQGPRAPTGATARRCA
jgi:hypothetical protein